MKPEKILARTPKVLDQSQREQFFRDGYLVIDPVSYTHLPLPTIYSV